MTHRAPARVEGQLLLTTTRTHQRLPPLLLLPVLSGIIAWASFPKLSQSYLAWVALVPLIFYVARVRRPRSAFLGGALAGMLQFLALLYWIPRVLTHYGGLPAPGAWSLFILMAAILGCYPAAACALTRFCMNRGGSGFLLILAPAWVTLDYVRSLFPFGGFPWLMVGYSQADYLRLIQIADLAGVYAVSFLIVWVNVVIAWVLVHRSYNGLATLGAAAMLAGALAYGTGSLHRWDRTQPEYRAALLQGNLSVDVPESALAWKYQQGYVQMADRLGPARIDLLVLPEAPSPVIFQHDPGYQEIQRSLAQRFPLGLVFNNIYFREVEGTSRYFNSAFFLDRNGTEVGRYDKIHLVPFGEYIPLQKLFFFSETISKDVGNFYPGNSFVTVPLGGHLTYVIMCFVAVFPELSRQFIRRGSQLIINLTNDAWYGDTSAPYQHLTMARWRAVECRRYLLRAANSGISAIVEPSGRIQVQTGLLREDTAVGGFAFLSGETFYARHGDSFPILCVIIICLALLWSLMRGTRLPVFPAHP